LRNVARRGPVTGTGSSLRRSNRAFQPRGARGRVVARANSKPGSRRPCVCTASTSIRGARASPRGWNEEDLTPFLRASAGLGLVAGRLPVNRSARPAQPERKHRRPATDLGLAGNGRMPPVTDVGEPGAGKQHARFDGAREEASVSRPRPHGVRRLPPTRPTSSYEIALGQPLPPPGRSQETNTCSTSDCHGRGVCPGPARGRSPRPLASLRGYEVHSSGGVAEMTWVGLPGGRM
jgi:hypothetical protein